MLRALQAALVTAFSEDELAELLTTRLGVELEQVTADGPLNLRVLELVRWAQRTGRLGELARAAAEMRPQNELVRAVTMLAEREMGRGTWDGVPTSERGDSPNGVQYKLGNLDASVEQMARDMQRLTAAMEGVEARVEAMSMRFTVMGVGVLILVGMLLWHLAGGALPLAHTGDPLLGAWELMLHALGIG